jgi:hypothetical protein
VGSGLDDRIADSGEALVRQHVRVAEDEEAFVAGLADQTTEGPHGDVGMPEAAAGNGLRLFLEDSGKRGGASVQSKWIDLLTGGFAMRRRIRPLISLALLWVVTISSSAAAPTQKIDLSIRRTDNPDVIKGPVTLELVNVNRLRYEIAIGLDVRLTDGPDLSLVGFIPDLPAAPEVAPPPTTTTEAATPVAEKAACEDIEDIEDIGEVITDIQSCLSTESKMIGGLVALAEESSRVLSQRLASIEKLLTSSDQTLSLDDGGTALAAKVRVERAALETEIKANSWPSAAEVGRHRKKIEDIIRQLEELPILKSSAFSEWINTEPPLVNYVLYQDLKGKAPKLLTALASIAPGSEAQKGFAQLVKNLRDSDRVLADVTTADAFQKTIVVACGYPYFKNKTFEYKVTRIDRTISDPAKAKSVEALITVECPSHFSISGGIGASEAEERDFAFVSARNDNGTPMNPQDDTLQTQFGLENSGDRQVNPLFLINTRLIRVDPKRAFNLHVSAGTVLDLDNPESDLSLGYMLGLTLSIKDDFFVTVGKQAIRIPELAGGFALGDPVPQGLEEPPLEQEWDISWAVALTYKLGARN